MLEWYVLSIIGFSLAFDQYRTILIANHPYPRFKLEPFFWTHQHGLENLQPFAC